MDFSTRIKMALASALYKKVVRNGQELNMSACASAVGKTLSHISRMISLSDDVPIQWEMATQIMKLKNDYTLLEVTADECGFVIFPKPKVARNKVEGGKIASAYQVVTSEAGDAVVKYFDLPDGMDEERYQRAIKALHAVIGQSVAVEKSVKKLGSEQLQLEI